jgi:hypothetical protein
MKTMSMKKTARQVLGDLLPDTMATNKRGNLILRWSFFYTMGCTAQRYVKAVTDELTRHGISHTIVDSGEVWKDFRGGASVAQGSHFFVEVKIED